MGLLDIFKATENKKLREENESIKQQYTQLQDSLTPELTDAVYLQQFTESLKQQKVQLNNELDSLTRTIDTKKEELIEIEEETLMQSFGLYTPKFQFTNSARYKEEIQRIRTKEKELIKQDTAIMGKTDWAINGNSKAGTKMVKDMKKLFLRAFNTECDELVAKVKYNNIESYEKRMNKSYEAISKLGTIMNLYISEEYYNLKCMELTLAYEYAQKLQEEKEEQRELRERLKEEEKLQKEIETEKNKLKKEHTHYLNAINKVRKQLETASDDKIKELEEKIRELQEQLEDNNKAIEDVDYRQANQRAGYVYIISNIGSFGEDVYKIGMTRRLNPQDRIDELSNASVPFKYDVHAVIFSEDAPTLETELHHAFFDKRVNWINNRKEFFNVTLDEIKKVVYEKYDNTIEFIDIPDAEQYRLTEKMKLEEQDANNNQV